MDNVKILLGSRLYDLDRARAKAVTSIPGWAEDYNELVGASNNSELYMTSPTAFRCINMRANALSAIPWAVVKEGKEDDVPQDQNNDAVKLLTEVNAETNWIDLIRGTENDIMIEGEGFWQKVMSGNRTTSLMRLNAATMDVEADSKGIKGFVQNKAKKNERKFEREEIVYFHTYNPTNDLRGLSPLTVAAGAIHVEVQTLNYMGSFLDNYAVPAGVLEVPGAMQEGDYQKVRRWWQRSFKGASNSHKTAILEQGFKYTPIGSQPKDIALEASRAEARRDICAVLGVPPAIAGAWEAANYASADEQHQAFYEDTIIPEAEYMAGVINAELIEPFGLKFKWDYEQLTVLQPDANAMRDSISKLVNAGVITPVAGAVYLGFQEDEAGQGPTQRGFIEDEPEDSDLKGDLAKWKKKAENSLERKNNACVDFDSQYIPKTVKARILRDLDSAGSKSAIAEVFKPYQEI